MAKSYHPYITIRVRTMRFEGDNVPLYSLAMRERVQEPAPSRSLLGKLWHRLLGAPEPQQPRLTAPRRRSVELPYSRTIDGDRPLQLSR